MKKRVILGVVFYLFVCFRFFFFLVVRGNLTYVSHVYISLLTLCFLDLFSLGISYCFPVFTFTVESFSVFFLLPSLLFRRVSCSRSNAHSRG